MQSSESSRNRWVALFPPLAVALLMIGGGLTPTGLDKPITSTSTALAELQIAAIHSGRLYASNLLVILGLGALGVAFVVIAGLCAGRPGWTLAVAAAVIGGIACFCGAVFNVLVGLDLAGAATAAATRDAAAHILVSTNTAFVSYGLLGTYLGGLGLASILMGIALWRSRSVPRWVAIGFPVGMLIGGSAPPGILNVLLSVPIAVVMIVLADRIWRGRSLPEVATPATSEAVAPAR